MSRVTRVVLCALALELFAGCGSQVDVIAEAVKAEAGAGQAEAGTGTCPYRTRDAGAGGSLDQVIALGVTRAICSCNGFSTSSGITTRGGLADGGTDTTQGGDVGVNEELSIGAGSDIGGALVVAGSSGLSLAGALDLRVAGDLAVGGPLQGPGSVTVLGNAAVADRVELGGLTVGGKLTQPSGASNHVSGTNSVGERRNAAIEVQKPCACDAASELAASASVASAMQPKLTATAGVAVRLEAAACTQYTLASHTGKSLSLRVQAPAALYVAGDLHLEGDLVVESAERADLDLFVAGNLKIDGMLRAGDRAHHARVRIFVADSGTLPLAGGGELYGLLYAPAAELVLSAPLNVEGALALGRISASAPISVTYAAP